MTIFNHHCCHGYICYMAGRSKKRLLHWPVQIWPLLAGWSTLDDSWHVRWSEFLKQIHSRIEIKTHGVWRGIPWVQQNLYIECFHISRHLSTDFPPQHKISLPRLRSYLNKVQPWHGALPQLQGSFITCSWGNITPLEKELQNANDCGCIGSTPAWGPMGSHGVKGMLFCFFVRYEGRVISFLKTSWQACS